jgi:CxxC motif-containing protein (DUF1111 family)
MLLAAGMSCLLGRAAQGSGTSAYTPASVSNNVGPRSGPGAGNVSAETAEPGQPLPGLTPDERARFDAGRAAFERSHEIASGLGPVFNDTACNRCHNKRGVGGAGIQSARLVGFSGGTAYDPLVAEGGPALAQNTVMLEPLADIRRLIPSCPLTRDGESVPARANVVARRRTTHLFGLGLVDATPDATFIELARRQPPAIRGRAPLVLDRATGQRVVGKLGWKGQAPSLQQFSGLALLLELGVTSPDFREEQAPQGNAAALAACDAAPEPEAAPAEIAALTDFMRLLAPVAPLTRDADARAGDAVFTRLGCDGCHVRQLSSGPSPIAALSERSYAPYSDFLLHDMGALGDGVVEGDAAPREMRTAPLWGARLAGSGRLLHDGRARSFSDAIAQHDGQGAAARRAFEAATERQRSELLAFLATL